MNPSIIHIIIFHNYFSHACSFRFTTSGAGFCQVAATNPMEIVKIRMQTQSLLPAAERQTTMEGKQGVAAGGLCAEGGAEGTHTHTHTHTPLSAWLSVVKHLGFSGMYRGVAVTWMRDVPFSFIFFRMYANMKVPLSPTRQQ